MCGICGTIGFVDRGLLKNMCKAMSHRGPDDEGFYFDEKAAFGIRRLKVIDLNTGNQPIHNEDKSVWLVFNGEIYNFRELRASLEQRGHRFYTKTDTEVIVHLYEERGEDCVACLEGMFAFALWDSRGQKLFIARDRLGVKPLYYCAMNGNLLFASELKSLLEYAPLQREIDPRALDCYLSFLYIPSPLSIFKGVYKLKPGHSLTFKEHILTITKYWDLHFKKDSSSDQRYYTEKIYALLKESVRSRLISDVPIGVFLSGGIDSSIVVGLMRELSDQPIKTFTIGYGKKDESYNELDYARAVATRFNTQHQEFIVKPDLLALLPKLTWHCDEPFADSSAVPTYLVSQVARKEITVALSGVGGDEGFGGYPRYGAMMLSEYYYRLPVAVKRALSGFLNGLPESTKSRDLIRWSKRFARGGLMRAQERYIDWVSYVRKEHRQRLYSPAMREALSRAEDCCAHEDYFRSADSTGLLDKIFYLDVKTYLADDLLCMGDRMSMANSLELREPLCDHRLLEFLASIPASLRIKGMNLKYLLKQSVSRLLPQDILHRRKQGFMIPIGGWIKEELKDLVTNILSQASVEKRGYFNYPYIKWLLRQHYEGRQNLDDQIWALLMFELWNRVYIDKTL